MTWKPQQERAESRLRDAEAHVAQLQKYPPIHKQLLEAIASDFPETQGPPRLEDSERLIWGAVGMRRLLDRLTAVYQEQQQQF